MVGLRDPPDAAGQHVQLVVRSEQPKSGGCPAREWRTECSVLPAAKITIHEDRTYCPDQTLPGESLVSIRQWRPEETAGPGRLVGPIGVTGQFVRCAGQNGRSMALCNYANLDLVVLD